MGQLTNGFRVLLESLSVAFGLVELISLVLLCLGQTGNKENGENQDHVQPRETRLERENGHKFKLSVSL